MLLVCSVDGLVVFWFVVYVLRVLCELLVLFLGCVVNGLC